MEYRVSGSNIAPDVVYRGQESDTRRVRSGAHRRSERGPTSKQLQRLAEGMRGPVVLAGRYRLDKLIGRGGMGSVFLAHHADLGRKVAVKVLDVPDADLRWAMDHFVREARLAVRARHPNIVRVHDFGTTPEGIGYIVMEHLVGRDLRSIIRRGHLSWGWTRHMMKQVCRGVGAIHKVGVIHRDLKPSNCFYIERRATLKILDFGVATTIRTPDGSKSDIVGTPEYMPPEQIRGQAVGPMADVYAAGILMYEMLTGHTPFTGYTAEEVFDRHLFGELPMLTELDDEDALPDVNAILARALSKRPEDRFPSMKALEQALDRVGESWFARLHTPDPSAVVPPMPGCDVDAPTLRAVTEPALDCASVAQHRGHKSGPVATQQPKLDKCAASSRG